MIDRPELRKGDLTGKSRLVSNVVTSWIALILITIAGFFLPRMIDTNVGQAGLGIWDFAWSITSYISLSHLGIGASLNRYVAKYRSANEPEALQTAVSTTVVLQSIIAGGVLIVSMMIYGLLPVFFGETLGIGLSTTQWVAFLLGASVAIQLLFDTSRGVLTGCHRWDVFNGINSSTQIVGTFAMITALYVGYSLVTISAIYLFTMTAQGALRRFAAIKICPEARFSRKAVSLAFAKDIFRYGLRSIVINTPGLLAHQSFNVAVVSTLGPATLAVLTRPFALTGLLNTFITRFTFILTPMAESIVHLEGKEQLVTFVKNASRYSFAFVLPPVTLLAVFGGDIITLWMGPEYVNETVIWVLALGALFAVPQSAILRVIIGLDHHGPAAKRALIMTVCAIVSSLVAGNLFSLYSIEYFAASITFVAVFVNGIYIPAYACNVLNIRHHDYLASIFKRSTIAVLLLGIAMLTIKTVLYPGLVKMIGYALVYLSLVGVIYFKALVPRKVKTELVKRVLKATEYFD